MRKLSLVAALALVTSCGTEPDALRLTATVDRTTVTATDSVRLTLELVNQSIWPKQVLPPEAYGICMHAFRVYDAQNREAAVNQVFCMAVATSLVAYPPRELAPGERITIKDWWRPFQTTIDGAPLPVDATYRLVGVAFADATVTAAPIDIRLISTSVLAR